VVFWWSSMHRSCLRASRNQHQKIDLYKIQCMIHYSFFVLYFVFFLLGSRLPGLHYIHQGSLGPSYSKQTFFDIYSRLSSLMRLSDVHTVAAVSSEFSSNNTSTVPALQISPSLCTILAIMPFCGLLMTVSIFILSITTSA